jgi:integrase
VRHYVNASKADNTKRAYGTAWAEFEQFCDEHHYPSLPAPAVAVVDYLTTLADAGQSVSTITVKLSAISFYHENAKADNPIKTPEVKATIAGIRRVKGIMPRRKAPATFDLLKTVITSLPHDLRGMRDKAILLLGFSGAFRRSELVAVQVEDLRIDLSGLTVLIRHSKTDQEGAGMTKTIPTLRNSDLCPVQALRAWMDAAGISSGPVFRSIDRWGHVHGAMDGREIARIVKRTATAAGIDPRQLSGHSLRAGFVTQAALDGVEVWAIKEQTGHKSDKVLMGYIRAAGRGARSAVKTVFGEEA